MDSGDIKKFILPGQVLGLTMIGLLLLSGLVYYKAVRTQRYLEPSLAIAQPRIDFAQNIDHLIKKEFGSAGMKGVLFAANSIFVDDSLIFPGPVKGNTVNHAVLKKLGRVFLSMFRDPNMKSHFDFILIGVRLPLRPNVKINKNRRMIKQHMAELILDSLYYVEPELEKKFGVHFTAAAVPVNLNKPENWIEFRIIPSERLHIEMIQSVGKYFSDM